MISVLYVDDEADLLEIAKLFLEQAPDFLVDTALSADEALQILEKKQYDAIIADYQMPEMDGIAFLQALRARKDTTPFIIFTGRGREEVIIQALNSGVDFYLQKGGDPTSQFAELKNIIIKSVRQKRAEDFQRQSEKRMAEILNHLPEATFAINHESRVIAWNMAIEEMTGVSTADILDKGNFLYAVPFYGTKRPMLIDLIDSENSVLEEMGYEDIRREGSALIAQTTRAHPKGKEMVLWIKATPFYDENGRRAGAIETMRDTTAERAAIRALRESEAKYRSILENIQDVYYRSDKDGNLVLASPSIAPLLGYDSASDLIGKNIAITTYFNPDQRREFLAEIDRAGSVTNFEVTLKTKDGRAVPVITSSHKYFDANGNFQGIEGIFKDVTEQKKTLDELRAAYEQITAAEEEMRAQYEELKFGQDALRRSEQKLQGIVNGSPIPQFVIDNNHKIISWNRALEVYSGVTEKEVIGTSQQWRAFYPSERPCMADLLVDSAEGEILQWYEGIYSKSKYLEGAYEATDFFPHMGPKGTWLHFTAALIRDAKGAIIGAVETLNDVSDLKTTEKNLRESEEKYRTILENIQDTYYRSDRDGNLIMISPSGARMLGYDSADDILGWNIAEKIYADPADRTRLLRTIQETGSVKDYVVNLKRKDGSIVTVSTNSQVYSDAEGTIQGIEGIIRDITDRRRAEESLKASENLYRSIFENTGAATIIIAPDTKILLANSTWVNLTGVKKEEQENLRSWTDFIYPEDVERMKQYHYARRKDPSLAPKRYEARLMDNSGTVHDCIVYVDVIAGTSNSVASLVDISDLKHAEEALRQINKKLNLMSSITRHDIINQVTAVSGYLELLKERISGEKEQEFIQQAATAARNIEHQITFTGMYQDIGVNSPRWQQVADIVRDAAGQLILGGVQLETDLDAIEVYADPLLVKVFYNLIENALRHGKKITRIRFSYRKTGEDLVIVCEDDGVGVPAGDKDRIFDRGFGRHTGFGLFLAREILSITGLSIRETGEPQQGARFEIKVPKSGFRMASGA